MDWRGFLPLNMDQWIEVGFGSVGGGGMVGLGCGSRTEFRWWL